MAYKTEQEEFWSGEFGNRYADRNSGDKLVASDVALFSEVFRHTEGIKSVMEFGSNIGLNLKAVRTLLPDASLDAVEINHRAAEILKNDPFFDRPVNVHEASVLEYEPDREYDFVIVKGVLIHINPDELDAVYRKLYSASGRYIFLCEYYNPTPVMVEYRGNRDRLYKRDFAGEFLGKYRDVRLVSYGFRYHLDPVFPMDDANWFLLEKTGRKGM